MVNRCVSCGQPIEYGPNGYPNHKCSQKHEMVMINVQRRRPQLFKGRTYSDKLREAAELMRNE